MRILFVFLLFISVSGNSQINITDTTTILGITKENITSVSTKINNAGFKSGETMDMPSSSVVLIIGAKRYNIGSEKFEYYEIAFKGAKYFIYKDEIVFTKISNGSEVLFDDLLKVPFDKLDGFKNYGVKISEYMEISRKDKAMKFIENCKPFGIVLLRNSIYDESEYTEGTSFGFQIQNLSNKTIKYITVNLIGYNSVNDKIIEKGTSIKTVKGVGPIPKNEAASFNYKYVWFTDLVETFKITSLKIQYMDGSIKNIDNPKLISLSQDDYNTIFDKIE